MIVLIIGIFSIVAIRREVGAVVRPRRDRGGHRDFLRSVCDNGGHDNSWFDDMVCGDSWTSASSS